MYQLEFTFDYQTIDKKDVLYALDKLCPKIGLKSNHYSQAYEVQLIERGIFSDLSGELFTETSCGSIANLKHDFLIIKTKEIDLDRLSFFVNLVCEELQASQAFILNCEYHYWQNAEDPMSYQISGKDHSHLPKAKRNAPSPFDTEIIDVSNNPGRYVLHNGFRELVSSPMWVRASLVKNMKALELLAINIQVYGGLLKITCNTTPFSSSEGAQKEIQIKLRNAVYGT